MKSGYDPKHVYIPLDESFVVESALFSKRKNLIIRVIHNKDKNRVMIEVSPSSDAFFDHYAAIKKMEEMGLIPNKEIAGATIEKVATTLLESIKIRIDESDKVIVAKGEFSVARESEYVVWLEGQISALNHRIGSIKRAFMNFIAPEYELIQLKSRVKAYTFALEKYKKLK